jgi:serine/threonine protein kinase
VRGVDLFEYVVEKNSLNEYDAALIAGQIIEAVQYIHALGVVHRDLKPENIMVVEETQKDLTADSHPKIKIIDFGLSNYVDILQKTTKEGSRFYYSETLVGTPNYIAP